MYEKALMLINGNAGPSFIQKNIELTAGILTNHIEELIIRKTHYKGHAEEVLQSTGKEYDLIIIMGGDGTVHECVNGLAALNDPPSVCILPGGTCNDFSRTLAVPQNIKRAADSLMNGTTRHVDIGTMNERFFTNFYGIGLIAQTSENINGDWKNKLGKVSYLLSALQTFTNPDPFSFELTLDDETMTDEAVMVLVVNGNFIGASQLPFQGIVPDDGLFNVFVVSQGGASLLREYLTAKNPFAWDPEPTDVKHYKARHVALSTPEPMKADTDGEIYMKTPAVIENLPARIPFLVPDTPQ
ncbi:diacylglycerol/lipid kinase family protein [Salibacterium halotolerans]|uniref:Lipid kinase, YegS/Rv2252/BmrU family n=1 Tax=Salibacterium halotolerans TaxID=1884432 RepID=A0A1I5RL52_9BACI|nr:diacylglycerol kinase family protein [Salibacterium halotolerans]SFP59272.1 lipid kinase, YegS/Rv2252/BmrU family [Salibacterium halotolerans]